MTIIPSATTKTVFLGKATMTLDGTNSYVAVKNISFKYGYDITQEHVIGSTDPIQATGGFSGTVEAEMIASTDNDALDWVTPASGQIVEKTFTIAELDLTPITAKTRTWTIKARWNQYQETGRELGFVMATISGVLTDEPTEAVT